MPTFSQGIVYNTVDVQVAGYTRFDSTTGGMYIEDVSLTTARRVVVAGTVTTTPVSATSTASSILLQLPQTVINHLGACFRVRAAFVGSTSASSTNVFTFKITYNARTAGTSLTIFSYTSPVIAISDSIAVVVDMFLAANTTGSTGTTHWGYSAIAQVGSAAAGTALAKQATLGTAINLTDSLPTFQCTFSSSTVDASAKMGATPVTCEIIS